MLTEKLNSNDINLTFIPTSKSDLLNDIENLLKKYFSNIPQSPTPNSPQSDFIFLDEVCELTNLSKPTIYSLVSRKQIPTAKQKGQKKLIFNRTEIMSWLKSGRPSIAEQQVAKQLNNRK